MVSATPVKAGLAWPRTIALAVLTTSALPAAASAVADSADSADRRAVSGTAPALSAVDSLLRQYDDGQTGITFKQHRPRPEQGSITPTSKRPEVRYLKIIGSGETRYCHGVETRLAEGAPPRLLTNAHCLAGPVCSPMIADATGAALAGDAKVQRYQIHVKGTSVAQLYTCRSPAGWSPCGPKATELDIAACEPIQPQPEPPPLMSATVGCEDPRQLERLGWTVVGFIGVSPKELWQSREVAIRAVTSLQIDSNVPDPVHGRHGSLVVEKVESPSDAFVPTDSGTPVFESRTGRRVCAILGRLDGGHVRTVPLHKGSTALQWLEKVYGLP